MYEIDPSLLKQIDALELSERNKAWRKAMKAAPWRVFVDRERLTVQSWKETEGEDLELRRAKMVKKIAENVAIGILEYFGFAQRNAVFFGHATCKVFCGTACKNEYFIVAMFGHCGYFLETQK